MARNTDFTPVVRLISLRSKHNNYFLANAINLLNVVSESTGVPQLTIPQVEKFDIYFPKNINEEIKLGRLFNEIDNLITLHHRKFSDILVYKLSTKFLFLKFAKNVWEQRKLPEIANISIGLVTTMTSHYMNHGVLLIRNSDIKDNKFEFDTDPIYLDEKFASENKHRQHQIGDVITVHTGDVGTSAVITENEVNSIGFATLISRPNKEIIDSHYLSTFYNTDKHKKFAVLMSTGDGRTNYNLGDFIELIVPFPKKGEQIKIARFIKNIDNLITLHHRKYTYIFYSWEQRKLNEVTDVRDGTHDSPKYFEFGHPFITSKNVKNGYINYDEIQYISDEDFNEINKRSKVDMNDILFGMIGTIGNIALIRENPDFAIKNVALIKDIKKINYLYLYQYLQSNNIAKQFDENMDGGTQKFIALNKVRDLSIMYPTISEQIQIGGFLEKLDNLITLHQHKELKRRNDNNEHLRW